MIRSISKSRAIQMAEYAKLKRAFWADPKNQRCLFPGCPVQDDKNPPTKLDLHHSKGRAGRLLCMVEFWIPVCRKHHTWIGDNPNIAREMGLLAPIGQWNSVPKDL